jgi:hypothetical protein
VNRIRSLLRVFCFVALAAIPGLSAAQEYGKEQIDQLTAQIALYPDSLLSQVLMASTYPTDVAEAARWSREHPDAKGDEAVKQVQDRDWDPSVASLVAFPQVIVTMGEKPDWVRDLGDAFLAQPEDVMDSVQRLRAQAQKAGNLKSNEQTTVRVEAAPAQTTVVQSAPQQVIVIEPAQPQVVYVPTYNPVTVYGSWMYPAYPPIYVPPPPGYWWSVAIGTGIAWGVSYAIRDALWGGCNWHRRDVNININRYNNININRRLDVNTTRARWAHDTKHRGAVPYRGGEATRQKLTRQAEVAKRDNYRGRAEATMRDKGVAVDRAAARDRDLSPPAGRDRDRPQVSRDQARDRAQAVTRDRPQPASRERERDRVQARDREQAKAELKKTNRDYPLKDAGSKQARPQVDRGTASRQSMQQHRRPQTRDVSTPQPRPQAQRPSPRPQAQPRPQPRTQARPAARPQAQRGAR